MVPKTQRASKIGLHAFTTFLVLISFSDFDSFDSRLFCQVTDDLKHFDQYDKSQTSLENSKNYSKMLNKLWTKVKRNKLLSDKVQKNIAERLLKRHKVDSDFVDHQLSKRIRLFHYCTQFEKGK